MPEQLLQRGDVVACGGRYFVVWTPGAEHIVAFPILRSVVATGAHHVTVSAAELASWHLKSPAGIDVAVQEDLPTDPALLILRIGRCSGGLVCRMVAAAARAYARKKTSESPRSACLLEAF